MGIDPDMKEGERNKRMLRYAFWVRCLADGDLLYELSTPLFHGNDSLFVVITSGAQYASREAYPAYANGDSYCLGYEANAAITFPAKYSAEDFLACHGYEIVDK